jgi:hypothetical protein
MSAFHIATTNASPNPPSVAERVRWEKGYDLRELRGGMTKKSDRPRQPSANGRHPASVAWDEFRALRAPLFAGSPKDWHLEDRLKLAFEDGWNAATRALLAALDHKKRANPAKPPS